MNIGFKIERIGIMCKNEKFKETNAIKDLGVFLGEQKEFEGKFHNSTNNTSKMYSTS